MEGDFNSESKRKLRYDAVDNAINPKQLGRQACQMLENPAAAICDFCEHPTFQAARDGKERIQDGGWGPSGWKLSLMEHFPLKAKSSIICRSPLLSDLAHCLPLRL